MTMKILLLSDIHANYPALKAVGEQFPPESFDMICNCGDSLVYGPFPNETIQWLEKYHVYSILGNTDRKVKKLLKGKSFKKPGKAEKRIMYTWTAKQLTDRSKKFLLAQKRTCKLSIKAIPLYLFHGSPDHPNEFLFPDTDIIRFQELAHSFPNSIIITGHSHSPYYKQVASTHFINPGSVGRMFDSNPAASFAILSLKKQSVNVTHFRIDYQIEDTTDGIAAAGLPEIYQLMYKSGQKLN